MYEESLDYEDLKEELKYKAKNLIIEELYKEAIEALFKLENIDRFIRYGEITTEISENILEYFKGGN